MVSWNVDRNREALGSLDGYEVALLQEVPALPADGARRVVPAIEGDWYTGGSGNRRWRTAIVSASPRVHLEPVDCRDFASDGFDGSCLGISCPGTIAAAHMSIHGEIVCTVVSVYAVWESVERDPGYIWADGSAHRILSDLEPLILRDPAVPVIVAGDWNIYRGYGEVGWPVFGERYGLVFERARLMGLEFLGPEWPGADRRADPPPVGLPDGSTCVPTRHTKNQGPAGAQHQLDFVFATRSIADRLRVRARNSVEDWGPSDHCRVEIDVMLPE
jgi:hypothetical protein